MRELWELFYIFAIIGVSTFGGGAAMLPILQREIVDKRSWATQDELTDYYAIGQCTPGIIAVNTATFVGCKSRGWLGGLMATLGVVFPSLVIIVCLAGLISAFADNIYVQKAFAGIKVCVCVLIFNAVLKLWKKAVTGTLTLVIYLAVLALALFTRVTPPVFVLISAALGIALELLRRRKGGGAE